MIKVAVIGATGYAGQELLRLLSKHPEVELKALVSHSYGKQEFAQVFPHFRNFVDITCTEDNIEQLSETVDIVFLALPHGLSSKQVNAELLTKCKVIDLGVHFRLKSIDTYNSWYEDEHGSPDLLNESVYGLCEWKRKEIAQARLVANPGCYATCTILSLLPLVQAGVLVPNSIVVDAKSGVSGAGRAATLSAHYNEVNENLKAYKIASHRHTPEIEQALSEHSSDPIQLTFTPHLVPMNRGILVTAYGTLTKSMTEQDLYEIYEKQYGAEPFVRLFKPDNGSSMFPETRWVKGSNFCDIGLAVDPRTKRVIVIGALDNLVKGAAGQAVQNMNILFGLPDHGTEPRTSVSSLINISRKTKGLTNQTNGRMVVRH